MSFLCTMAHAIGLTLATACPTADVSTPAPSIPPMPPVVIEKPVVILKEVPVPVMPQLHRMPRPTMIIIIEVIPARQRED